MVNAYWSPSKLVTFDLQHAQNPFQVEKQFVRLYYRQLLETNLKKKKKKKKKNWIYENGLDRRSLVNQQT